ncbi:helix-turn-helix domain-containing protein [Chitinophaga sp. GCM10012297]|uniref:Helix-turn-helix transcriptional regulator n=1 Tax=Chitinophaga chungangae TaxID=2821488 RepID=A0ABS3YB60_9BACT|nr:helix-turn-helix transcriptional regulator [Chitinophaga chungangae]MBO9151902.1 helix-turn-helix transcriptional regulator [Chitinophaga chungangae]
MSGKDFKKIIGNNLRALRIKKGWNQKVAGERTGIAAKTYQSYEYGRAAPAIFVLVRLAEFYGITVNDLLTENFEKNEN